MNHPFTCDRVRQLVWLGVLVAAPSIAPAASFVWNSGHFVPGSTAPEPLASPDVLEINTGTFKYFDAVTFTNQSGTVNWNSDTLYFQNGATVNNQSIWDAKGNNAFQFNGGATPTFNNTGTFRKSGGAGDTTIGSIAFVNSGTIDAQTGTINFSGGNATFNAGTQFTGAGTNRVSASAVFNGSFTSSNLVLSNGNFNGTAAQLNGTATVTGGVFNGTWEVAGGATLIGNSGGFKYFDGATVTNNGTTNWLTSNPLFLQNGGSFTNNSLFHFQADSGFIFNGGAVPTVTNSATGTIRSSAGSTGTIGAIAFVNNGGTLEANGELVYSGGNATFNSGTSFTGTGVNRVTNNAAFAGTINSANLTLQGGTYTGSGATLAGTTNFTGGTFTGTWNLPNGATLNGNGGSFKYLDGATFTNSGALQWSTSSPWYFQNGSTFDNQGTYTFGANSSILYSGGATPTFNNTGTVAVTSGFSSTIGAIAFVNNAGTIAADGTLNFAGGNATFNNGTVFTGTGTNLVTANAAFNGNFTSTNLRLESGTFTGSGATLTSGTLQFNGGSMTGTWNVSPSTVMNVGSGGFKYLSGPGTVLTNQGTVNWQTTNFYYLENGATIANQGTFNISNTTTLVNNGGPALPQFNNTGLLTVAAGQTGVIGTIAFVNNGGTLQADGTLNFNGGNATFNHGTIFSGSGSNLVTGNAAFNGTSTSSNLVLQSGTFTGTNAVLNGTVSFTGGTLTGTIETGPATTLNVSNGGFKYLAGPSTSLVNRGTMNWQTTNAFYLENGAVLDNRGQMNVTASTTFVNNGGPGVPSITNSGTFVSNPGAGGTVTVNTPVTNSGLVDVQFGHLNFNTAASIQGTGTLQIGAAGRATVGGPSTVGTLVNNGSVANSLTLGSDTITVSSDYSNANFGTGNSFNRRANVSTSGVGNRIIAAGDANQGITGAGVVNGTSTTPTLTIGNVHVGASTVSYNIANTGTTGPALRGAIQTSVNGANISDGRLSGDGVTAGNWGPVATGASASKDVTFTVASAGVYAPVTGQAVNILNNFDNTRSQLVTINSAAGAAAYQLAAANALATPVNLGNTRIGGTLDSNLSITNTAPNTGGYTETLGATVTGTTGGVTTAGAVTALANGATSTAISAGFSTATAGAKNGTATVAFTSHEINNSGLGTTGIGHQVVALNGAVYQPAVANSLPASVNLGNARVGGTLGTTVGVTNTAPNTGGYTETLGATVTSTSGAVSTTGTVSGLGQGASSNAIAANLNTASAGAKAGSATLAFTSSEINGSGLGTIGAGSQTVNFSGNVYRLAEATLGTLNFGNVLVGSSQTRYLSVTNSALADGFSEGLDAALGAFSGPSAGLLSNTGGSLTNLAAGASDNATLAVTLNTNAAGAVTASVQVLLGSNGATTSGLGVLALAPQQVAIDGLIQANVGNLAVAGPATPNPVNLGNVRVGDAAPSQALSISNVQVGPAEGLNASISTATPGLTATGAFNNLAPGATDNSSLIVSMNTATAGSRNGSATIALASDGTFNSGNVTALAPQNVNVTGAVYQPAAANALPATVNVGNARVGDSLAAALGITNVAPNTGGYTEILGAAVTATSGGVLPSGTVTGLAQGASSNAISLGFDTSTAGARNGTATLGFTSSEINGSGLGTIGVGSQTVNVSGAVYHPALANALAPSIDLGTMRVGTVVATALGITNTAPLTGGYTETLGATVGPVSPSLAGTGSVTGLAAGASSNALGVQLTAATPGAYNGSATVNFLSQEINGSGLGNLALASQTVNLTANINAVAQLGISNQSVFTFTPTGANSADLDFGTLNAATLLSAPLTLANLAAGPSDSLLGSFLLAGLGGTPFGFTGAPSFDLAAGAGQGFVLQFNPTVDGAFSGTIAMTLASHNAFQSDLDLGIYTITVRGQLTTGGGRVPDSPVGLIGTLTLLATAVLGVRYRRNR